MIRRIGIFFLCISITTIFSVIGVMAYKLWDEYRAEDIIAQISLILSEKIEKSGKTTSRINELVTELDESITYLEEATPQIDEIIPEPKEKLKQVDEVIQQEIDPISKLDKLVFKLDEVILQSDENTLDLVEIAGEYYIGILNIPSLSLNLPINNEWNDLKLKESACRYSGNITSSLVICAHDYKSHFGKIPNLSNGDTVTIIDAKGYEHQYQVEAVTLLDGTNIDDMINNPYDLTLFTCFFNDNTKRVTVRCTKTQAIDDLSEEIVDEITESESEAPNYKIDYKKEIIKLKKGDLYSLDDGNNFTEVTKTGTSLDVSDCITNGTEIQIKKLATAKKLASKVQIITPIARAILEDITLSCKNGKITLDTKKYEVYNPKTKKWGGVPNVTENIEFDIRIKSNVEVTKPNMTINAASIIGKLKITYDVYDTTKNKSGIIAAEIITIEGAGTFIFD